MAFLKHRPLSVSITGNNFLNRLIPNAFLSLSNTSITASIVSSSIRIISITEFLLNIIVNRTCSFVLFATCATHKWGFLILCTFEISYSITNLGTIKINAQSTFSTAILITTHMLFCTGGSIYTILTTQIGHFNFCSILFYFSGYT